MKVLREAFQDQELSELIILADAVSGLMHDLNNGLNRVALQASVIQMNSGDHLRDEVVLIRREVAQATALLRPLHLVRQRQRQQATAVDLNETVDDVLAGMPDLADRVHFEPKAGLPSMTTSVSGLQRLIAYFLRLGLAGQTTKTPIRLRTDAPGEGVRLVLELPVKRGSAQRLAELFDPETSMSVPDSLLERLALQSLLRLLNGSLSPLKKPSSGVAVTWACE